MSTWPQLVVVDVGAEHLRLRAEQEQLVDPPRGACVVAHEEAATRAFVVGLLEEIGRPRARSVFAADGAHEGA